MRKKLKAFVSRAGLRLRTKRLWARFLQTLRESEEAVARVPRRPLSCGMKGVCPLCPFLALPG